ncbi:MAG: hypothetical protein IJW00_09855 [Clostridia bacterium]|nr:hypothetical protein [Clostridia bacterium]MBQ9781229.1 hypothetical protein [Clostridia bacterium]
MKKLIKKILNKVKEFFKWVWKECKDWHTLVLLGIVCLVLSSPIWICYILGFIFDWAWAFWVATAVWGFWMLPGAPFFALSISITLAIKKIVQKVRKKRLASGENSEAGETDTVEEQE